MPAPLIAPLIQSGIGLVQSVVGGIKAGKAQKQLEKLQTPGYTKSQGILDFYDKALGRYNVNPYDSNLYKVQQQNVARGTAQGLNALGDRRSALAGVSSLVQGQNDAMLKAGVSAEAMRDQRFGQLGQAASMKANEDMNDYQYNRLMPYEKKYNLLAMKASGGNQTQQAGMQNVFGGLSNISQYQTAKELYGSGGGGGSQYTGMTVGRGSSLPNYRP